VAPVAVIPNKYYSNPDGEIDGQAIPYKPFDPSLTATQVEEINAQQTRRNAMFEAWIKAIYEVSVLHDAPMPYMLLQAPENWWVQPNMAALWFPTLNADPAETFDSVTHLHMDAWAPAVAAQVLIARARE
jgi:hypothetical protein